MRVEYDREAIASEVRGNHRVALGGVALAVASVVGWLVWDNPGLVGFAVVGLGIAAVFRFVAWLTMRTPATLDWWAWTLHPDGMELAQVGRLRWEEIDHITLRTVYHGSSGSAGAGGAAGALGHSLGTALIVRSGVSPKSLILEITLADGDAVNARLESEGRTTLPPQPPHILRSGLSTEPEPQVALDALGREAAANNVELRQA